jgi:hypothetical protein
VTGPRFAQRQVRDRAGTTGLPEGLKAGIESLSRVSMDDVRVHTNSARPSALRALAYTQGSDIYLAPGQERNLAHEAWHVVQQKQGRVPPTLRAGGLSINTDRGLEEEADRRGAQAASAGPRGVPAAPARAQGTRTDVIQGVFTYRNLKEATLKALLEDVRRFLDDAYPDLVDAFDNARRDKKKTYKLADWLKVNEVDEKVTKIPRRATSASTKRKRSDADDDVIESPKKKELKPIDDFAALRLDRSFDPKAFSNWNWPRREEASSEEYLDLEDFVNIMEADGSESEYVDSDEDPIEVSQALRRVFGVATFNIDHYPQSADVTRRESMSTKAMVDLTKVRKKKTRMDEIAYFLSTDNPDVLVIQEIQDFEGFRKDFEAAPFMTAATAKSGETYAVGLDQLPEAKTPPPLLSSQYALIEQPRWSAGNWSEKNAIIVNRATMDVSSELWILPSGEKKLKKIQASDPRAFGKSESGKKAEHQPRDPVVTTLTYYPGTPDERKIAIINVHTSPSGDLKQQNEDIYSALKKIEHQLTDVDVAFAIGDFYMEKSNPDLYKKLHANIDPLEQPEFPTGGKAEYTGVRTMFDTNIPSPHGPAYKLWDYEWDADLRKYVRRAKTASQPEDETRDLSKKGQKADMLIYKDDQWRPYNKLPNIYPPMFPSYITKRKVDESRKTRLDLEDRPTISAAAPGKETYELADGGVVVLEQQHIDAWGKPIADHALRIFRGELPPRKPRKLERRKSMRLGLKAREEKRLEQERLERERLERERLERERLERERLERERLERERRKRERRKRERLEKERREKERLEKERLEQERREKKRRKQERRAEKERRKREAERRAEKERRKFESSDDESQRPEQRSDDESERPEQRSDDESERPEQRSDDESERSAKEVEKKRKRKRT